MNEIPIIERIEFIHGHPGGEGVYYSTTKRAIFLAKITKKERRYFKAVQMG